jgi:hypothetical protein
MLKTTTIISISWVVLRDESSLLVSTLVMLAVIVAGSLEAAHSVAWDIQNAMRFCPAPLLKYLLVLYPLKPRAPVDHAACIDARQTV